MVILICFRIVYEAYCENIKSSVIRQKGESENAGNKKTKQAKFSLKQTFLTPWYAHVSVRMGGKNVCFTENLACFVSLLPTFWNSSICLITDEILLQDQCNAHPTSWMCMLWKLEQRLSISNSVLTFYLVSDKQLFRREYFIHLFIHFIFTHCHIVFKLTTNTSSMMNQH